MTAPERLPVNEETDGLSDQRNQRDRQHPIVKDGTGLFVSLFRTRRRNRKATRMIPVPFATRISGMFMGSLLSLSGDEMDKNHFLMQGLYPVGISGSDSAGRVVQAPFGETGHTINLIIS